MPIASYFMTMPSRIQSQDSKLFHSIAITDSNNSSDPPKILFPAWADTYEESDTNGFISFQHKICCLYSVQPA